MLQYHQLLHVVLTHQDYRKIQQDQVLLQVLEDQKLQLDRHFLLAQGIQKPLEFLELLWLLIHQVFQQDPLGQTLQAVLMHQVPQRVLECQTLLLVLLILVFQVSQVFQGPHWLPETR